MQLYLKRFFVHVRSPGGINSAAHVLQYADAESGDKIIDFLRQLLIDGDCWKQWQK